MPRKQASPGKSDGYVRQIRPRRVVATGEARWCVYIVECADRSLYTGIARDVTLRVAQHNDGSGARYTRGRRPVRLVYIEVAADRGSALSREYEIKRLPAASKRQLQSPSTRECT